MNARTLGAQRVRLFSPTGNLAVERNPAVERIKRAGAELIDAINAAGGEPRLKALGMTAAEESTMWGVKAVVTSPAPEEP